MLINELVVPVAFYSREGGGGGGGEGELFILTVLCVAVYQPFIVATTYLSPNFEPSPRVLQHATKLDWQYTVSHPLSHSIATDKHSLQIQKSSRRTETSIGDLKCPCM